jgi:hypothetical protein
MGVGLILATLFFYLKLTLIGKLSLFLKRQYPIM